MRSIDVLQIFLVSILFHLIFQTPMQEGEIVKALLDRSATLDTMVITSLLSARSTNALGDYEVEFVYDPPAVVLLQE
jgi:arachidonate 5-lipoxygenase